MSSKEYERSFIDKGQTITGRAGKAYGILYSQGTVL